MVPKRTKVAYWRHICGICRFWPPTVTSSLYDFPLGTCAFLEVLPGKSGICLFYATAPESVPKVSDVAYAPNMPDITEVGSGLARGKVAYMGHISPLWWHKRGICHLDMPLLRLLYATTYLRGGVGVLGG